jgi:molecular chaperone GrpE
MSKQDVNAPEDDFIAPEIIDDEGNETASLRSSIEALEKQLAAAEHMVSEQQEQVLRAQAEMQNVRRRSEKDVENAHKYAVDRFVGELLPVIDSLERALEVSDKLEGDSMAAMKEGIELTIKMFLGAIGKFQIEQVNPINQPFNPEFHQAMSMVPNADVAPNTVLLVMQKGYTLHGRLVRPAMVMVSKATS